MCTDRLHDGKVDLFIKKNKRNACYHIVNEGQKLLCFDATFQEMEEKSLYFVYMIR